jgi:carbon monoxide dehydrogenase subunit G
MMLPQPRVTVSDVVSAPVDEVWAAIRDFDAIDQWHPGITDCSIEDGHGSAEIGAVRSFQAGEKSLREKLLAHSDQDRSYQYTILDGGGAKVDYLSELRAIPVTESEETLVHWTGAFDAPDSAMADEKAGVTNVYTTGLEGIRDRLE